MLPLPYTFVEVLGRGATAETIAATDGARALVIKRLLPHAASRAAARDALAREARILGRLAGRGAPRLVAAAVDLPAPYLVTERFAGAPLAMVAPDVLVARFAELAGSAFGALARVHEAEDARGALRVVHGDVSPSNVLVGESEVWLVDFELGSDREGGPPADGAFRGTLATVAPEVARGEAPTPRADLFALAASLVGALAASRGARPLRDETRDGGAGWVHAAETPVSFDASLVAAYAPPALAPLLAACLAHDPETRPVSARAIVEALGLQR
ncbi:MAG: hypothetical protein U0235_21140 [Polyangiaceae bacterium]